MSDEIDQRRREHLGRIGVGPVMAEKIMANVRWQECLPHQWCDCPDGKRCTACELTWTEAHTNWPGPGTMPCIDQVVRS